MILFRAIGTDEYNKLISGQKVIGEKDFSTYYLETTSRGICFFKVDSIGDDEVEVFDKNTGTKVYVDVDRILQLTNNYDSYEYGIFVEVPDDRGLRTHGTYYNPNTREFYRVNEICFKAYGIGVVKSIFDFHTLKRVYNK